MDGFGNNELLLKLIDNVNENFKFIIDHIKKKRLEDKNYFFSNEIFKKLLLLNGIETELILMELSGKFFI
jgi:hypothetical protein